MLNAYIVKLFYIKRLYLLCELFLGFNTFFVKFIFL